MPVFQRFQMALGRRCRDPRAIRPIGVPVRNMGLYEELLFNNLTGFLDACFPVCRRMLGDTRWRRINRAFFRDWRCATPLFRDIPREFIWFLGEVSFPFPAWFSELAHYEWAELAVDTCNPPDVPHDPRGDVLHGHPVINPALMNLAYAWPVHRIGADYRPRKPVQTNLLVFRNADDEVRFVETNTMTARLIDLILEHSETGVTAIHRLADEVPEQIAIAVRQHGPGILNELCHQGIILGVRI
jgi:hypothetical protein